MAYVIAEPCIDVLDVSCVSVCPVDCIHFDEGTDRKLFIDPNECIDCGACEPECPVNAIFPEESLPPEWANYTADRRDVVHGQGRRPGRRRRAEAAPDRDPGPPGRADRRPDSSDAHRLAPPVRHRDRVRHRPARRARRRHPRVRLPAGGRAASPVMTRSVHDLATPSSRDIHRLSPRPSTAARRCTRSTRRRSPPPSPT